MSDNADSTYKVKIETAADVKGAADAATALRNVSAASEGVVDGAKKQTKHTGEAADALTQFGSRSGEAHHAAMALSQVMQGGERSVFGMARALYALREALAVNPFTFFLAALGALVPLLFSLREKVAGVGDDSKAAGEKAKAAFDEAAVAARTMSEVSFGALKGELDAIKDRSKTARDEFTYLQEAADKLDDAEMAAQLAENKVDPGLTPEQRSTNERSIRRNFAEQKRQRVEAGWLNEEENSADATNSMIEVREKRREAFLDQYAETEELRAAPKQIEKSIDDLTKELAYLQKQPGGTSPEAMQRGERMSDISYQLEALRQRKKLSEGDEFKATVSQSEQQRDAREREYIEASTAAREAEKKHNQLLKYHYTLDAQGTLIRSAKLREETAETIGAPGDFREYPDERKPAMVVMDAASMRADPSRLHYLKQVADQPLGENLTAEITHLTSLFTGYTEQAHSAMQAAAKKIEQLNSKIEIAGKRYDELGRKIEQIDSVNRSNNRVPAH